MQCPNCKTECPPGSDFCTNCGWDFPPETVSAEGRTTSSLVKCPECGAGNPPDAPMCSLCAAVLEAQEPEPAASGPAAAAEPPPAAAPDSGPEVEHSGSVKTLRERVDRGEMDARTLVQLGDAYLAEGSREAAARAYLDALYIDPKDTPTIEKYETQFSVDELLEWGLAKAPRAVWADIGGLLRYPLLQGGWLVILLGAIFWRVMNLGAGFAGFYGLFPLLLAWAWLTTHITSHLRWAAVGKHGHPPPVDLDFSNIWYFFCAWLAGFVPFLLVLIVGMAGIVGSAVSSADSYEEQRMPPAFVEDVETLREQGRLPEDFALPGEAPGGTAGDPWAEGPIDEDGAAQFGLMALVTAVVAFGFYLLGAFYTPMALLACRLFNAPGVAFNYPFIFRSMATIFGDYTVCALLLALVGGVMWAVQAFLFKAMPFLQYLFVVDLVAIYLMTLDAHVLGRLYYNNQKRLAWF